MALYIPHSIFHLERLLYVRPETFGPYYLHIRKRGVPLNVTILRTLKQSNRVNYKIGTVCNF